MNLYYYVQTNSEIERLFDEFVNKFDELLENKKVITDNDELFSFNIPEETLSCNYSEKAINDVYKYQFLRCIQSHFYNRNNFTNYISEAKSINSNSYECKFLIQKSLEVSNKLFLEFKVYLSELQDFYFANPGFKKALEQYPVTARTHYFFRCLTKDNFELRYVGNNRENYFKLMYNLIEGRYIEIKPNEIARVKNEIHKYKADSNESIKEISKKIYSQFSKETGYPGVRCPDNLPFLSLLSKETAKDIAYLLLKYVFIPGTSYNLIIKLLLNKVIIIPAEEKANYINYPNLQTSPIIRNKKLGFLTYLLITLNDNDLIRFNLKESHDGAYDKLAKNKLFKVNKKNKSPYYPNKEHFISSYSDCYSKYQNYNRIDDLKKDNPEFWKFKNEIDNIIKNHISAKKYN